MEQAIMNAFYIVAVVMLFGGIAILLSGRAIDKQTRILRERNKRESERMHRLFPDGDHAHG